MGPEIQPVHSREDVGSGNEKAQENAKETQGLAEDDKHLGSTEPLLGVGAEFQPIEMLPRPTNAPYSSLSPLHSHPSPSSSTPSHPKPPAPQGRRLGPQPPHPY